MTKKKKPTFTHRAINFFEAFRPGRWLPVFEAKNKDEAPVASDYVSQIAAPPMPISALVSSPQPPKPRVPLVPLHLRNRVMPRPALQPAPQAPKQP